MGFRKREYIDRETIITAESMNEIQDAILDLEDGLFSIDNDKSGEIIAVTDAAKRGFRSLNIFGKTKQNGTPTPNAPVDLVSAGNDGTLAVNVCGKNLLKFAVEGKTYTDSGITVTFDKDGCVANGTPTKNYVRVCTIANFALPKGTYYVSGGSAGKFYAQVNITKNDTVFYYINKAFTIDGTETRVEVALQTSTVEETGTIANYRVYPMLVIGSIAPTEYESYKGQILTLSTPNGLPGIPVTSGGNYTDANGQQWICDEIDFARGVYVQRVYKETFATDSLSKIEQTKTTKYYSMAKYASTGLIKALCSIMGQDKYSYHSLDSEHWYVDQGFNIFILNESTSVFEALGDIAVVYDLKVPIETPLPEEEIADYAALHTYKDNTTVSNDAGAYMELEYVMDAKKYIDSLVAGGSSGTILPARVE